MKFKKTNLLIVCYLISPSILHAQIVERALYFGYGTYNKSSAV